MLLLLIAPLPAFSLPGSGGDVASETTQKLNFGQLVLQLKNAKEQLDQIKENLNLAHDNIETLSPSDWVQVVDTFDALYQEWERGQAISYSTSGYINEIFKFSQDYLHLDDKGLRDAYLQRHQEWSQRNKSMLENALNTMNLGHEHAKDKQALLERLAVLSRTPKGRQQTLQLANQIALEQSNQLRLMNDTLVRQQNLIVAIEAEKKELSDIERVRDAKFFEQGPRRNTNDGFKPSKVQRR